MTAQTVEDFEGGTPGGACTTGNTTFDDFMQNWTFQNLPKPLPGGGSLCGHPVSSSSTAIARKLFTPMPKRYSRWDVLLTSYPPSTIAIENAGTGAGTCGDVRITAAGAVQLRSSASVEVALSSVSLPLNKWCRIERFYDSVNGRAQLWVYTVDPNGTTAQYDSGLTPATTNGSITQVQVGIMNTSTWSGLYIDNYADDDTAKIGPVVSASPPPGLVADVTADVEPGNTVTLTAAHNGGSGPFTFAQTGGATAAVSGTDPTRTVVAPPTIAGDTLTFTVTDSAGTSAPVSIDVLPAPYQVLQGGVWKPAYSKLY